MKKFSSISALSKRLYRHYSNALLYQLKRRGFSDLRPSFLEILLFITENEGPSIKAIGNACHLKKQTMTSHINELIGRGYIIKKSGPEDKREQLIFLTDYGMRFQMAMIESMDTIEREIKEVVGDVELRRIETFLREFMERIADTNSNLESDN